MSSSNSSEIEDQLTIVFQGVMEEAMNMLQAKEAMAAAASSSIVIVKWLISGCSMTTSMTIACTPVLLPPEVSYTDDSFPKHYA
jgi:3-polyprenyl-4-hydroxybenzoate decarboxylase